MTEIERFLFLKSLKSLLFSPLDGRLLPTQPTGTLFTFTSQSYEILTLPLAGSLKGLQKRKNMKFL